MCHILIVRTLEGESYDNSDEEWNDYDDGDSGSSGYNEEEEVSS